MCSLFMNDSHVQKVDKFSGNSWTTKRLINCTSTCLNIALIVFLCRKFYFILISFKKIQELELKRLVDWILEVFSSADILL